MLSLFQCYKIFKYYFIFSIFLYLQACSLDPSLFDEELKDVTEIKQTQKFLNEFDITVVKSGDTLFGIARRFGVSVQKIVEINNLGLNNVIFTGQVLKIPKISGSNSVTLNKNKDLKIVTLPQPKPDIFKISSRIIKVKFYSPLDGEIITKFGIKSDGVMNEGIYIEADYGTIVKSSADGEVIFVGSDLKDFGKLLIVKHSENLITSYAHLSKIYVNEGEIITGGQPIAEVGSSGKVTKSQLYFEIRQDNEALDPITYLDS